jgi:hypothetical protein
MNHLDGHREAEAAAYVERQDIVGDAIAGVKRDAAWIEADQVRQIAEKGYATQGSNAGREMILVAEIERLRGIVDDYARAEAAFTADDSDVNMKRLEAADRAILAAAAQPAEAAP